MAMSLACPLWMLVMEVDILNDRPELGGHPVHLVPKAGHSLKPLEPLL